MLLSPERRFGIKITGKCIIHVFVHTCVHKYVFLFSLIELIKYLFMTEKISQDPLEQFFECQRQRGRFSDNPNVKELFKSTQALQVVNSLRTNVTKGNCRDKKRASMTESHLKVQVLPKRRYIRNSV